PIRATEKQLWPAWPALLPRTVTATRPRRLRILFWTQDWCNIDSARWVYLWQCQKETWWAPSPGRQAVKKVICEGWLSFRIGREAVSRRLCSRLLKLRSEISVASASHSTRPNLLHARCASTRAMALPDLVRSQIFSGCRCTNGSNFSEVFRASPEATN